MVVFIEGGYCIFPPKLFLFICAPYVILLNFLKSFFLVVVLYFLVVFWPDFFSLLFFGCLVINTLNCQWFYPLSNNCIVYLTINEWGWVSYEGGGGCYPSRPYMIRKPNWFKCHTYMHLTLTLSSAHVKFDV